MFFLLLLIYFLVKFAPLYSKLLIYNERDIVIAKLIMLYAAHYAHFGKGKCIGIQGGRTCVYFVLCVVIMVVSTV